MLQFHPYGFLISLGILAGLVVAWWRKKIYGLTSNDLENLFLLIIPLGIVGARIYHVLDKWSYYSQNPMQIVAVWNGGLGVFGAVGGGILGIWIFTKVYGVRHTVYQILDFIIPSLAIGQAIGRWGNFFNQEVFGPPTNLPWKWFISENLRPEMWKNYEFFHPIFLYESLWVFLGFIILLVLERCIVFQETGPVNQQPQKYSHKGTPILGRPVGCHPSELSIGLLTGFYCVWYGLGRFFLEYLRFDTAEIWGIKTAQIISLLLIVLGLYCLLRALNIKKYQS